MRYIVQAKLNNTWQAVEYAGLPLVLFEGEPIPPDAVIADQMRCIPLDMQEELA